jgi:hypothetical protein
MAPAPVSPLNIALGHLETAERELAAQLSCHLGAADSVRRELDLAREAIAGLRKLGGARDVAAPPPVVPPAPARARVTAAGKAVLAKGHAGRAAAQVRSRAILQLVAEQPRSSFDLRAALPVPAGVTAQQHKQSVSNALSRMAASGLVKRQGDDWAATAMGRKSAAAPAKEAP